MEVFYNSNSVRESVDRAKKQVSSFLDNFRLMSIEERTDALKSLNKVFHEMLGHGKKKVDIAVKAYCSVEKHIRNLDESLSRFEEEELIGPSISKDPNFGDHPTMPRSHPTESSPSSYSSFGKSSMPSSSFPPRKRSLCHSDSPVPEEGV